MPQDLPSCLPKRLAYVFVRRGFEMAFCELKYFSKALEKATAATVLLPEGPQKGPFPVLYLLHGLSDDQTAWTRWTSVERYVRSLPLIVVMPESGRGFYCDAEQGFAYET